MNPPTVSQSGRQLSPPCDIAQGKFVTFTFTFENLGPEPIVLDNVGIGEFGVVDGKFQSPEWARPYSIGPGQHSFDVSMLFEEVGGYLLFVQVHETEAGAWLLPRLADGREQVGIRVDVSSYTATPTLTSSPVPTPCPTPLTRSNPTSTSTATPRPMSRPVLVRPLSGDSVQGLITFEWTWDEALEPSWYFDVRIRKHPDSRAEYRGVSLPIKAHIITVDIQSLVEDRIHWNTWPEGSVEQGDEIWWGVAVVVWDSTDSAALQTLVESQLRAIVLSGESPDSLSTSEPPTLEPCDCNRIDCKACSCSERCCCQCCPKCQ